MIINMEEMMMLSNIKTKMGLRIKMMMRKLNNQFFLQFNAKANDLWYLHEGTQLEVNDVMGLQFLSNES